jgi:hypothetical protein
MGNLKESVIYALLGFSFASLLALALNWENLR